MVVSESADSSFWHKCTMKADRGAEVFDMLPLRGVGPVVPVPESAVDQFAGLSCARPQSGFCGESVCSADAAEQLSWSVATFRGELGADAFPPASAFRRRMFALSRSSCSSRSPFFENRARPLHAFLLLPPFRGPRSRPQTPTAIGAYGNWPENAHVGVWLRWVVFFGVAGEENKARAACRAGASKISGRRPPL